MSVDNKAAGRQKLQGIEAAWKTVIESGRRAGSVVYEHTEPARNAKKVALPEAIHPVLEQALRANGVDALYSHQAEAYAAAFGGSVIVTTGTASGKSLCFNLPVLTTLCSDPQARALYIYPTKALAQDQARSLHSLGLKNLRPAIYDGDTPKSERAAIRKKADLVLTNPDMLHLAILPHHRAWREFFANLVCVVVDEAHVYRGVFGSHMGNVLRRLRRITQLYGNEPRFLLASATVSNPLELAERLTGLTDFQLIDGDGSPAAKRRVVVWNPQLVDEKLQTRRSALQEAAEIVTELVLSGTRTICFIKSRKGVELIARSVQQRLKNSDPALTQKVAPYRSGYTAAQRRELESDLVAGRLLAVVATDALELGIDIGDLDVSLCVTFPGTVASLRQMWGRAGRRREGAAIFLTGEDALDRYFSRHPKKLLTRPVEAAILNHQNSQIYSGHLLCAAFEEPLSKYNSVALGDRWQVSAEQLVEQGSLRKNRNGTYVCSNPADYPADSAKLRLSSADNVNVVDLQSGEVLGSVETARAYSTLHQGAVYLHLGQSYEVTELELEHSRAWVKPFTGNWYTQPKREIDTRIKTVVQQRTVPGAELYFGTVVVTEQVLAFQRKKTDDHSFLGLEKLDLPTTHFTTEALWYELDEKILKQAIPAEDLLGALHATEHSQIAVLPLLAMCDRWDIGGLSTALHSQTGKPAVFIYDGHPGGVGITRRGFECFELLTRNALDLIGECPCKTGCPGCIQSPKCGNLNEPLSKSGAVALLSNLSPS